MCVFVDCRNCSPLQCLSGILLQFYPENTNENTNTSCLSHHLFHCMSAFSGHPLYFISALPLPSCWFGGAETLTVIRVNRYGVLNWTQGPHQGDEGTAFVAQINAFKMKLGKINFCVYFPCFALLPEVFEFPL